jgi:hypothetical protein
LNGVRCQTRPCHRTRDTPRPASEKEAPLPGLKKKGELSKSQSSGSAVDRLADHRPVDHLGRASGSAAVAAGRVFDRHRPVGPPGHLADFVDRVDPISNHSLGSGSGNASMGLNVPESTYSCTCKGAFMPPTKSVEGNVPGPCLAWLGITLRNVDRIPLVESVARRVVFGVASGPGPFPQAPQPRRPGPHYCLLKNK